MWNRYENEKNIKHIYSKRQCRLRSYGSVRNKKNATLLASSVSQGFKVHIHVRLKFCRYRKCGSYQIYDNRLYFWTTNLSRMTLSKINLVKIILLISSLMYSVVYRICSESIGQLRTYSNNYWHVVWIHFLNIL